MKKIIFASLGMPCLFISALTQHNVIDDAAQRNRTVLA